MLADLTKAGVTQVDEMGRRADYHALRHTFAKRLDACEPAYGRALTLKTHHGSPREPGSSLAANRAAGLRAVLGGTPNSEPS
jgi:hypothetical protein